MYLALYVLINRSGWLDLVGFRLRAVQVCNVEKSSFILLSFFLFPSLVCDNMERYNSASPFLCMDLTYITALLKEGFGFTDNTLLQVRKRFKS